MHRATVTRRAACVGLIAVGLAGCDSPPVAPQEGPPPVVPGTAGADSSYRLAVGDTIGIHFIAYPDLDDTAQIGPDGHVALRLINDIAVAGLTVDEAAKRIDAQYQTVIRHPGVSLTIRSYALQQVYVEGEVNSPGVVRSTVPLTVSTAIAQAGGVKLPSAHAEDTLLLRRTPDGAIAYYRLQFSGDLPVSGPTDPFLRTNDVIFVPRTAIASVADYVQSNLLRMVPYVVTPTFTHSF
jgi:polysaccharide biosynthesis/export protein